MTTATPELSLIPMSVLLMKEENREKYVSKRQQAIDEQESTDRKREKSRSGSSCRPAFL